MPWSLYFSRRGNYLVCLVFGGIYEGVIFLNCVVNVNLMYCGKRMFVLWYLSIVYKLALNRMFYKCGDVAYLSGFVV